MNRRPYPSDVSDEEWAFVAPYLSLLPQTAAQRRHELREAFNALRWMVRAGAPWRMLPVHFPPWEAVYQQTRRWIAAGSFEAIVHDLRLLIRAAAGRRPQPSVAIVDSRTLRSTVESGQRAGVDGQKGVRGSKVHAVVDTMGTLLALAVTPANVYMLQIHDQFPSIPLWLLWLRLPLQVVLLWLIWWGSRWRKGSRHYYE